MSRGPAPSISLIILVVFVFAILLLLTLNPWLFTAYMEMFDQLQETVGVIGTWTILIIAAVVIAFIIVSMFVPRHR